MIQRALDTITRAAEPIGRQALSERIVRDCTRKVLGDRAKPETKAECDAILAAVKEELAFIVRRKNGAEEAPELARVFQAAADELRRG
jgi:hypothetical protein